MALVRLRSDALDVFAQRGSALRAIYTTPLVSPAPALSAGDSDGDGTDEVAVARFSGGWQLAVYGDQGAGIAEQQAIPGNASMMRWLNGNGDAFDDLWLGGSSYDSVFCGASGAGVLGVCWTSLTPYNATRHLAVGDADDDGDDDVAVTSEVETRAYRNVGGQYAETLLLDASDPSLRVVDVDWLPVDACAGDELVAAVRNVPAFTTTWRVWRWNGEVFEPQAPLPIPTPSLTQAEWADLDGDGDLDPMVCDGASVALYRRDGDTYERVWSHPAYRCAMAWGDYDADGDPDVAADIADGDSGALVVLRNDAGTFVEAMRSAPSDAAVDVTWARCGALATSPCFPVNTP